MQEKTSFYFATYEVKGSIGLLGDRTKSREEHVREALSNYIQSDSAVVETDTGDWYFGSYKDYPSYTIGKFGKVYTDEPVTYDEDVGDFVEKLQPNVDADYSMFLLHFDKNLLIFNTTYRVRHKNFIKHFELGFKENTKGSLEIEIDYMYNEDDIDTVVQDFPVINAEFQLQPSNPHSEDAWEELDDHIQNMLASELDIDIDTLEGQSLNFEDDALDQMFQMSKSDYGQYEIVYNDEGQIKVINSEESDPVQTRRDEPETLESLKSAASELIQFADSFLE